MVIEFLIHHEKKSKIKKDDVFVVCLGIAPPPRVSRFYIAKSIYIYMEDPTYEPTEFLIPTSQPTNLRTHYRLADLEQNDLNLILYITIPLIAIAIIFGIFYRRRIYNACL